MLADHSISSFPTQISLTRGDMCPLFRRHVHLQDSWKPAPSSLCSPLIMPCLSSHDSTHGEWRRQWRQPAWAVAVLRAEINSSTLLTHLVLTVGEFYSRDSLKWYILKPKFPWALCLCVCPCVLVSVRLCICRGRGGFILLRESFLQSQINNES